MTTDIDSPSHMAVRPTTRVISRNLRNFSEFSEVFAQWNGQFYQMSRGQFRGSIQVVAGQNVRVFAAETNQSILTRGMSSEFATFIPITTRNEATIWQGRSLSAGQLIVKRPEAEYHNLTSRNTTIRALLVPVRLLKDAARILSGSKADFQFPTWSAPRLATRAMTRVETGLSELITVALQDPAFLGSKEGIAFEMECLRRVINAVAPSSMADDNSLGPSTRVALVSRAVDLMHAHLDQPLTAFDLCEELGTSDRTLRRAFRETYGLGPLAYFRVIRLHAVRAALQAAQGSHDSVADIAGRWGFHRLGSFANEYRVQFGALPSHTLGVRGAKTSRHGK
jgi:AraC family ethanolamine operon transcriptional activator